MHRITQGKLRRDLRREPLRGRENGWVKTYYCSPESENSLAPYREIWALSNSRIKVNKPRLVSTRFQEDILIELTLTHLPGVPMTQISAKNGKLRRESYRKMGEALRDLHATPVIESDKKVEVPSQIDRSTRAIEALEKLFPEYSKVLEESREFCLSCQVDHSSCIVHGDLTAENAIISCDKNMTVGFLDWEFSGIGDINVDLARLEAGFYGLDYRPLYSTCDDRAYFYEGYGGTIKKIIQSSQFKLSFTALNFNMLLFFISQNAQYDFSKHFDKQQDVLRR